MKLNTNVLSEYEKAIYSRRPYLDRLELSIAAKRLNKYVISTGYLCPIDAYIEQINFWFPGRKIHRPICRDIIQLELEFPNWDSNAQLKAPNVPSGNENFDDEVSWEWDDDKNEDNHDLPF